MAEKKQTTQAYISNGQSLSSPPLGVRVSRLFDSAIAFGALYLTTLFSVDSYAAAAGSPFSTGYRESYRTGGNPGRGTGYGGDGNRGQRLGTMANVRANEGRNMPAPVRVCGGGGCM